MQLKKGELISIEITKIAFGGAGIGHYDNRVVFVENTVPGDKILAKLTKIKQNFLEAKMEEIQTPGDIRIKPRCKHFNECGGCSMQYLDYKNQLEFKELQVKESLEHIGNFSDTHVKKIIECKTPWHYRNKMEFTFSMNKDNKIHLGLHPKGYRYDVFDLKECYLESEDIGELIKLVQNFADEKNLKAYNFKTNSGLLRTLTVREGKRTGERLINLTTSHEEFEYKNDFVKLLTGSSHIQHPTSIYITKHISKKGAKTTFTRENIYGKPYLTEELHINNNQKLSFHILPDAFFQTNTFQAEILYNHVLALGEISHTDTVYDLFCGTGTIGLFCAHKAKLIFGVDLNKNAIENAKQNALLNNISNAEYQAGDAFKIIEGREDNPDIVIIDPPRAGLTEALCNHLLKIKAKRIIYVSCNPGTLARDLKILCENKYSLKEVQPVDMFPQTYHIEIICKLEIR
ncbi:23S rRNA (uracil(1939)-C(5))-methyltransferase RlmD [bacterium]|nr:23S rRNA (uracil(1939)-C(5))-methyltransferase RlmD [bacterium]